MSSKKTVYDSKSKLGSKFKYEPIPHDKCKLIFDQMKTKLIEIDFDNSILTKIDTISNETKKILEIADEYCCGLIRANGLFSIVKLVYNSFAFMINELENEKNKVKFIGDCLKMIDLILVMLEKIEIIRENTNLQNKQEIENFENELLNYPEFHRKLSVFRPLIVTKQTSDNSSNESNSILEKDIINGANQGQKFNSLPLISINLTTITDGCLEIICESSIKRDIVFGRFFACWMDKDITWFFKFYNFILPFYRAHLYQYPRLIFSSEYRAKFNNQIIRHCTLNFPFDVWDLMDTKIPILLTNYWTRNCDVKSNEIRIPKQTSILISTSPVDRLIFNDVNEINFDHSQTIRCRFIKPNNFDLDNCDKLILHFHGGGFFCLSGDSHDVFLKFWVHNIKIPILTVDYQLKKAFPAGLQDCFDVYLFIRKAENKIRSLIGYQPKKIVIAADSAGSNFGLGITLVLNDLRTDYESKFNMKIKMPDGLVLCYSPFLVQLFATPSRGLSAMDLFIPLGVLINVSEAISGLIPGLKPNSTLDKLIYFLFPSLDRFTWLDGQDENKMKDHFKFLTTNITSPYLTSLFYDKKFDQITDVPLHLISAEFCPFLDESITLAKLWKGDLKVDVIDGMFHGFLNLNFVDRKVFEAMIFCGEQIVEMFENCESKQIN